MAGGILSSLLSKPEFVLYNQTMGMATAKGAKVIKVSIKLTSDPMRHSMEDGSTFIDTRIIKPPKVQVDLIAPDDDTLSQVNAVMLDRKSLYQITSRGIILPDVMVEAESMEQTANNISSTVMKLSFQQVLIENTLQIIVTNAADASIIDRGRAVVGEVTETVSGLFDKATNAASNLIG